MISIREATERDAAELSQLAERTFRDTFASANSAEDMEAHCRTTYGASIQLSEINDSSRTTLLCHASDRLIAYGQLRWNAAPACVVASKPAEIQRLYVDVPWHGKGVSQALMASLLSKALAGGADVAWLGVWERNPRAVSFYEKSGFGVVGEHVFTLGNDPQRDLILAKELI
ncbi:MAG: GNAT family N-acetyltransferase [Burkholderiales bacterium]|nr:GNAT family N-acetyltransferase [Burkholderiales bacterium]MCL4688473.1 GNAT family N-acetyltransferase [Burkholderiales bacterium]